VVVAAAARRMKMAAPRARNCRLSLRGLYEIHRLASGSRLVVPKPQEVKGTNDFMSGRSLCFLLFNIAIILLLFRSLMRVDFVTAGSKRIDIVLPVLNSEVITACSDNLGLRHFRKKKLNSRDLANSVECGESEGTEVRARWMSNLSHGQDKPLVYRVLLR
jgi:hypothetical protein